VPQLQTAVFAAPVSTKVHHSRKMTTIIGKENNKRD